MKVTYFRQVSWWWKKSEARLLCIKISSLAIESPLVKVQCSGALGLSIWRNSELSKKLFVVKVLAACEFVHQILSLSSINIIATRVKFLLISHIMVWMEK